MKTFAAVLILALAACSTHKDPPLLGGSPTTGTRPQDRPPSAPDIHFMSGMIPHHAQAVKIARWANTHGASPNLVALTERIVVGQTDEIHIMQTWLRDRGQKVPAEDATHLKMNMNGTEHDMLMPGMLNDEELAELDRARGVEFDRLFLRAMIKHHLGAIEMVNELFASRNAAQDDVIFKFASDVYADQTTEIERMQKMLDAMPPAAGRAP
jgi:uncharacterized protein (DUF305 family)